MEEGRCSLCRHWGKGVGENGDYHSKGLGCGRFRKATDHELRGKIRRMRKKIRQRAGRLLGARKNDIERRKIGEVKR